jgi:hypothetical protein
MLSFFPNPYPDELFYSIVTRYHIRSGNKSFKQTLIELLEYYPNQSYSLVLPNNLSHLLKRVPSTSILNFEKLIWGHTLYPFYRIFLTSSEAWSLSKCMRERLSEPIHKVAKISQHSELKQTYLKFCPDCVRQDMDNFGEAYWHRTHQVPGIFICLIHNSLLIESRIPLITSNLQHEPANLENCVLSSAKVCSPDIIQCIKELATNIELLMQCDISFQGLPWLRNQYQNHLMQGGFIPKKRGDKVCFDAQAFLREILCSYQQEFWDIVRPGIYSKLEEYLAYCLLGCDMTPTIERVTHIILISFLSESLQDFFGNQFTQRRNILGI